jgi:hypothetical protein
MTTQSTTEIHETGERTKPISVSYQRLVLPGVAKSLG